MSNAVTILPDDAEPWMPTIEVYIALAKALHNASDDCNANYAVAFHGCQFRQADIQEAIDILRDLRKDDWQLVRRPAGTRELGL